MKIDERLTVKELADALGVSQRYIYQMRRCGFQMDGLKRDSQTTTLLAAVVWIVKNDFRMSNGKGRVRGQ